MGFADALNENKSREEEIELASGGGAGAGAVTAVPLSNDTPLDPELVAILQSTDTFMIQQKVQWGEALTQGLCEQQNIYTVADKASNRNVLLVQEQSQALNRCCCAPEHSFFAKFYILNDDGQTKKSEQAVMTMEREGCDCCFTGPCPKPCLCCFACTEACSDGARFYAGDLEGNPGVTKGERERTRLLGEMVQPIGGGGFKPVLQIMDRDATQGNNDAPAEMFAATRGPCCFGGCSEFCCDTDFGISIAHPGQTVAELHELPFGDFASIKKRKPSSFGGALRELFTDSDIYEVTFLSKDITVQQKANILASMVHLDFMFFERDNDMCYCENGDIHIVLFNCFCYGCICPCECVFSPGDSGGGGD